MIQNYKDKKEAEPKQIRKLGNKSLNIVWSDDHISEYTFYRLRIHCPCAACVDELSGKKVLDSKQVAPLIQGLNVNIIGNYALSIIFEDGHSTGIYPFKLLRKICSCKLCLEN
ncbi:MAG: DUF971 domain-containing protein [Elusimicrobia bacterium]|nr:DUF971 domain-containing protein [Elusimicrobiota bacterium]